MFDWTPGEMPCWIKLFFDDLRFPLDNIVGTPIPVRHLRREATNVSTIKAPKI